jgi:hypothetical protein
MKSCAYCGAQYPDETVVCPLDGHPLSATVESHAPGVQLRPPKVLCPACGAPDDYKPAIELRRSFGWAALIAGGLPGLFLWNAGRPKRVRCNKCEATFDIRTPLSKISLVIFWILVGPAIILLIVLALWALHSIFSR